MEWIRHLLIIVRNYLNDFFRVITSNATTATALNPAKTKNSIARWSPLNCKYDSDRVFRIVSISKPTIGNKYKKYLRSLYFFHVIKSTTMRQRNMMMRYINNLISYLINSLFRDRTSNKTSTPIDHCTTRCHPKTVVAWHTPSTASGGTRARVITLRRTLPLLNCYIIPPERLISRVQLTAWVHKTPNVVLESFICLINTITNSSNSQSKVSPFLPIGRVAAGRLKIVRVLRRWIRHVFIRSRILQRTCLEC